MLKDGHKHLSGLEEAVVKNLEACKQLSQITRTSLGPNGEESWSSSFPICSVDPLSAACAPCTSAEPP